MQQGSLSLSPSLSQKSTYLESDAPPAQPHFLPPSPFLCGVEGAGALPQVAGATEGAAAAAALIEGQKCKETGGKGGTEQLQLVFSRAQQHVVA